ncbi:hypothetical protein JNO12_21350 [Erwinia aphidicola]|nr:hypothetical protein [Erwinia aphidicola]
MNKIAFFNPLSVYNFALKDELSQLQRHTSPESSGLPSVRSMKQSEHPVLV